MPDRSEAGLSLPLLDRALQRLVDEAPLHLWLTDGEGKTLWASASWLAFSGRDRASDLATSWAARVWPEDVPRVWKLLTEGFAAHVPVEAGYRIQRADGQWRRVITRGVPHFADDGSYAGHVGITHDFTELRAHEDRVTALAEQQRMILDHLRVAVFTVDRESRLRFVNRTYERAFNQQRDEVVGRVVHEVFPPDVSDALLAENARVLESPESPFETEKDMPTVDGPRPFFVQKIAIPDADGVTPLICGVATDLSAVRAAEAERMQMERRLQQAMRLESLGMLAGGIAHDFNNLLVGILGNAELALPDAPEGSPVRGALERIADASRRAAEIAGQMRDYAGRGTHGLVRANLAERVGRMRESLARTLPPEAALVLDLDPATPPSDFDPEQVQRLVAHLLTNAGEALGGAAGEVRLRVCAGSPTPEEVDASVTGDPGSCGGDVLIEVRDTGCGMDAPTRRRACEPFFTTRFAGRGLGLSVILGVVRAHHGTLCITSTPGAGTTVRAWLPIKPVAHTRAASTAHAAPLPGAAPDHPAPHGRTALVVDDEFSVRELVVLALQQAGYDSIPAEDGRAAVAAWEAHRDRITLVIADRTMPNLGGEAMARELRRLGATVPIVLMSGFDTDPGMRVSDPALSFLDKPFSVTTLLATVRALEAPSRPA